MRRGLQVVVGAFGVVAVVAGLATVLIGSASIVGAGPLLPTADSELRFYAAWYVAAGTLALRSAPRVETETGVLQIVFAGLFLGGCARVLSLLTIGRPHWVSLVLMGVELLLPMIVVPWQAAVARRAAPAGR